VHGNQFAREKRHSDDKTKVRDGAFRTRISWSVQKADGRLRTVIPQLLDLELIEIVSEEIDRPLLWHAEKVPNPLRILQNIARMHQHVVAGF
jgi:hypothetical protein